MGSVFFIVAVGCVLIAVATAMIGVVVSLRARNLDADVLAHCTLPGLVLGVLLAPLFGFEHMGGQQALSILFAILAAAAASIALGRLGGTVQRLTGLGADSLQALLLGGGFGLGLVLLSLVQSYVPSQRAGLDQLLLGNAALMSGALVWMSLGLVSLLLVMFTLWGRQIQAFLFDPEGWRLRGGRLWMAELLYVIALFAVTVLGMRIMGAVLVVALLTFPYAIAQLFVHKRFFVLLWTAALVGGGGALGGVFLSNLPLLSQAEGLPTGPSVVLVLGSMLWAAVTVRQGVQMMIRPPS